MINRLFVFFVIADTVLFPGVVSASRLVTFRFEAVYEREASAAFFPVPMGTRVTGSYTFDLDTPAENLTGTTTARRYPSAVRDFNVQIEGFGEGSGSDGSVFIGAPVQTSGSFNFLSDQYSVNAPVSGISLSTRVFGTRNLIGARIQLQDLDLEGIDTLDLQPTPPDLSFFLDNTGPTFDSDNAELLLTFDIASGGGNANPFRLMSLTAVPEPSTSILLSLAAWAFCLARVRRLKQE